MLDSIVIRRADPFALVRQMTAALDHAAFGPVQPGFPAINLWQNDDAVAIIAEVPAVEPQDISIAVKDDILTITGERRPPELPEGAFWQRRERAFGHFTRAVRLPFRVDPDKAEARLADGLLRIVLRRPEADRPRRIEIKAA